MYSETVDLASFSHMPSSMSGRLVCHLQVSLSSASLFTSSLHSPGGRPYIHQPSVLINVFVEMRAASFKHPLLSVVMGVRMW